MLHVLFAANPNDLIPVFHSICKISKDDQFSFGEETALTEVVDMRYNDS